PRPDEVQKRDRRREQNRRAAQKFRKKKKERGEHLMEETQRLECHNTTLLTEIKQLHEEREQLTRIIRSHASVCPLTPRQSPLTIVRESPLPGSIRGSPLTLPLSAAASILAKSPVMGKSPVVVQSPVLLVPPTRESPVPLLILNPTRESPIPGRVVPSSPVPMSGRPRKSPVSILRINQSPIPGEKFGDRSPIPFGSPPKQSKHSIPPRLNLAGPKPVVPILPKPAANSTPSPKTPLGVTMSPLPTATSPITAGGRTIHMSPVFFGEGCFTRSGRTRQISQSPISVTDSSNSSTPARITQQSPVFFGDRAPSSAQSAVHFLQPSSASSTSSTSSLASLLRRESPLSVISNSSVFSNNNGTVFVGSSSSSTNSSSSQLSSISQADSTAPIIANTNININSINNNNLSSNNNAINNNSFGSSGAIDNNMFNNINSQIKPPVFMGGSQSSAAREAHDDDVLCLEDIERSATGVEARDDLIDFIDIQALLELSGEQNGPSTIEPNRNQQDDSGSSLNISQTRNNFDSLTMNHIEDSMMDESATHGAHLDADIGHLNTDNVCQSMCQRENILSSPDFDRETQANTIQRITQNLLPFDQSLSGLQQTGSSFGCHNNDSGQAGHFQNSLLSSQQGCGAFHTNSCTTSNLRQDLNYSLDTRRQVGSFGGQQESAFRGPVVEQDMTSTLKDYFKPHQENMLTPQTLAALQNSLRELLNAQNRMAQCNASTNPSSGDERRIGDADVNSAATSAAVNNDNNLMSSGDASLGSNNFGSSIGGINDNSESDFMSLQSSLSMDMLLACSNMCSTSSENRFPQAGNQYS
ncbi:homeobox protein 2, partial [Biomphalaria glabrata]